MFDVKAPAAPILPTHDRAANDSRRTGFSREGIIPTEKNASNVMTLSRLKPVLQAVVGGFKSARQALDFNLSTSPVGANSFAKAVCQAKMFFGSGQFANEFAPTESLTHSRASLAPTGSKHA